MRLARQPVIYVAEPSWWWEVRVRSALQLEAYRSAERARIAARLHQAALRAPHAASYKHEAPSGGTERASTTSTRSGGPSGCSDQSA